MIKTSDDKLTSDEEIKDCFKDADVYNEFKSLAAEEQALIIEDIVSQKTEEAQDTRINAHIRKLATGK